MSLFIRLVKITIYFFLAWLFLLSLVYYRIVSMELLSLSPGNFWDFINAPWIINTIKSSQFGLPAATLIASGLFSTLSLVLPAILLSVPVLFHFWKEGIPGPIETTARIFARAPFFWWAMLFVGFAGLFDWKPEKTPLLPFLVAFIYYSLLGINFIKKPLNWQAKASFVLMASGGHLAFETVMAWPGIGPLLFNSILQQDHILAAVVFVTIISLIMVINLLWKIGEEITMRIFREENP